MKAKTRRNFLVKKFGLGQRRCGFCCIQLNFASGQSNSVSVDHIIPKSKGGTSGQVNSFMVCARCNSERGDTNFMEWVTRKDFPRREWHAYLYKEACYYFMLLQGRPPEGAPTLTKRKR